jgi:hypothetical protein
MTSPILNTKRAVERRLKAAFPTTAIAYEGVSFTPPTNALYMHTQFAIRPPDEPTIGSKYYREIISFQVFVCDVTNKGTSNAITVAEQVRALFDKGVYLEEQTTKIHITKTPQIAGSSIVEDRIVVPVLIELWAEAYKD